MQFDMQFVCQRSRLAKARCWTFPLTKGRGRSDNQVLQRLQNGTLAGPMHYRLDGNRLITLQGRDG